MPTTQSASPRLRAASSSGFMRLPSRKASKPDLMASRVWEEIQSRLTGWWRPGSPRAPRAGGGFEPLPPAPVAQSVEARPYGLVGEGGDPEPPDRLAAPGEPVEVGEDELALPSCVAGVDHFRDGGGADGPLDGVEVLTGL